MPDNMKTLYTAEVTATGGRSGHVRSSDGVIDMKVTLPEGLGGDGGSTNPEQLFAAGYAACFQSALLVVSKMQHVELPADSTVTAQVDLNKFENGGYGLGVRLKVDLKGMDQQQGRELVDKAHQICPYSVGIKDNVKVDLEVV